MKEKYELIGGGDEAYRIRLTKRHWFSKWVLEKDGEDVKKYPVDQKNCAHRLKYAYTARYYYRPIPIQIYRCEKCGYEQVGTSHIQGNTYE